MVPNGSNKERKGEESCMFGILRNSTAKTNIETKMFIRYSI